MYRDTFEICIVLSCVLGMILEIYGSGLTLFFLSSCLLIISSKIIKKRVDIVFPRQFHYFILIFLLLRLIRGDIANIPFGIVMFFVFLGFYFGNARKSLFFKIYHIAANINVVVFLIQTIMKWIYGYSFSGIFSFLPIARGGGEMDVTWYQETQMYSPRCCAFFAEPSHLAQFLLPLLAIDLFCNTNGKKSIWTLLYFFTLVLLQSGCGYWGLLVVIVFYLFDKVKTMKLYMLIPLFISFLIFTSFMIYAVTMTEAGNKLVERQAELDPSEGESSGFTRIYRGYFIYEMLDAKEKVLGISSEKIEKYVSKSAFKSFEKDDGIYLNTVQRLLICDGLVGLVGFMLFLFCFICKCNLAGRCVLSVYIAMMLVESLYFSASMQLYMVAAFCMRKENVPWKQTKLIF